MVDENIDPRTVESMKKFSDYSKSAKENMLFKKGIIIPMSCNGIKIRVLACGERKKKRAA